MNDAAGPLVSAVSNRPVGRTASTRIRRSDITNIVLLEKTNFVMLLGAYREGSGDERFVKMAGEVK
jgi:hypothetical protein